MDDNLITPNLRKINQNPIPEFKREPIDFESAEKWANTDFLNDLLVNAIKELQGKKESVVKERLEEICPNFDFKTEGLRMFPNIKTIIDGRFEHWYYNDGTIDGKRIVTFEMQQPNFSNSTMNTGYTYY